MVNREKTNWRRLTIAANSCQGDEGFRQSVAQMSNVRSMNIREKTLDHPRHRWRAFFCPDLDQSVFWRDAGYTA